MENCRHDPFIEVKTPDGRVLGRLCQCGETLHVDDFFKVQAMDNITLSIQYTPHPVPEQVIIDPELGEKIRKANIYHEFVGEVLWYFTHAFVMLHKGEMDSVLANFRMADHYARIAHEELVLKPMEAERKKKKPYPPVCQLCGGTGAVKAPGNTPAWMDCPTGCRRYL